MDSLFAIVATGEARYLDEAVASINWHLTRQPRAQFVLYLDPATTPPATGAEVRFFEPFSTSAPPMVVAWYRKTQVLKELLEETSVPVCLLDTYARILDFPLFASALSWSRQHHFCLSFDPRRTLSRELELGRGIGPEVLSDLRSIPGMFPLWNTGVIVASSHPTSRALASSWEELSRGYLERGLLFREQLTLIQAVDRTGVTPFTLPENFNVRRPFITPPVVLHTRRFGHVYGVPDVDQPQQSFERFRHRTKLALAQWSGLKQWFYP